MPTINMYKCHYCGTLIALPTLIVENYHYCGWECYRRKRSCPPVTKHPEFRFAKRTDDIISEDEA